MPRSPRPTRTVNRCRYGEVVAAVRMDGSPARVLRHAIRQAYTSGIMHRDTVTFKEQLGERDGNLDEWGDEMLTTLPGGVAIRYEGEVIGAIGAGGGKTLPRDTEIARIAVAAIGLKADPKAQK
jgi:glc operon protein GlcG